MEREKSLRFLGLAEEEGIGGVVFDGVIGGQVTYFNGVWVVIAERYTDA